MSKALYRLISGIVAGLAIVGEAIVVYAGTKGFQYAAPIAASIPLVKECIDQVLLNFVNPDLTKKK